MTFARFALACLAAAGFAAAGFAANAADPGCASLTPTGKLRAGVNKSNALLAPIAEDVPNELARRLGVPIDFVMYATPGHVADAAAKNEWDVAFIAIEESRAKAIAFSPALTEIDVTYAVDRDSRLKIVADVDSPGVRIGAAEKSAYEIFLSKALREATVVKTKQLEGAIEAYRAGQVRVIAGLRPALVAALSRQPELRILDGRFMALQHGLGVPRDRGPGAEACVKSAMEAMIAEGFVAKSIERHGVKGVAATRPPG